MFALSKWYFLLVAFHVLKIRAILNDDIERQLVRHNTTPVSRSKRFLVFPEGSSFQLVFDLAYPALNTVGLYVFGHTAAMAWELPSSPEFFDKKFKKEEEPTTTTELPHLDHHFDYGHDWQGGKFAGWHNRQEVVPQRPPVSSYHNPFDEFRRRQDPEGFSGRREWERKRGSHFVSRPAILRDYGTPGRDLMHLVHRRTRREMYGKLEGLLSRLVKDGKSCILKTICQVNKSPMEKGNFWEELLKTIFKVRPNGFHYDEDHYDRAANWEHDCERMYPDCEGNIINTIISNVLKK